MRKETRGHNFCFVSSEGKLSSQDKSSEEKSRAGETCSSPGGLMDQQGTPRKLQVHLCDTGPLESRRETELARTDSSTGTASPV